MVNTMSSSLNIYLLVNQFDKIVGQGLALAAKNTYTKTAGASPCPTKKLLKYIDILAAKLKFLAMTNIDLHLKTKHRSIYSVSDYQLIPKYNQHLLYNNLKSKSKQRLEYHVDLTHSLNKPVANSREFLPFAFE